MSVQVNNVMFCDCVSGVSWTRGSHLSRLVIDLQSQFSGGSQDKGQGVLLTAAIPSIVLMVKETMFIRTSQNVMQDVFSYCVFSFHQYLSTTLGSLQGISWTVSVDLTQHWQQESSGLSGAWNKAGITHLDYLKLKYKYIEPKGKTWTTHQPLISIKKIFLKT